MSIWTVVDGPGIEWELFGLTALLGLTGQDAMVICLLLGSLGIITPLVQRYRGKG
jgi:hypothetical protein